VSAPPLMLKVSAPSSASVTVAGELNYGALLAPPQAVKKLVSKVVKTSVFTLFNISFMGTL